MAPVIGVVGVVAVAGILYAISANKNKKPAAAAGGDSTEQAFDPFAGVKSESGPKPMNPGGRSTGEVNRSPSGLLQDPVWIEASAKANEGYALHAAAKKALRAKDNDAYVSNGVSAKELFNKLFEDTYYWEEGLIQKYSEDDRRVKQIMAERSKWLDVAHGYNTLKRD
jgi:hypothetical protein